MKLTADDYAIIFWALTLLVSAAAYIRHLAWSIGLLMSDGNIAVQKLVLAGIGVLAPPIGVIHGFILWFS
jgi:hypothetical protein